MFVFSSQYGTNYFSFNSSVATNQWQNPNLNYSYLGTQPDIRNNFGTNSGSNNSHPLNVSINSRVDSSPIIADKSVNPKQTSGTSEVKSSSVSPQLSVFTNSSVEPKVQKTSNSVAIKSESVPQQTQSSSNSGIRFQLTKQTPNINKTVNNNSFPVKTKTNETNNSMEKQTNCLKSEARNQSSSTEETTPDQWPETLRDYVNRAFSACVNELDKDRIEIILKGKLTKAHHEGVLFTKDWTIEPLPQLSSPKTVSNYNSKQNSHSLVANKERNFKNKETDRKRKPRSRSPSKSPDLYDLNSDSGSPNDRFRERTKKKQKKLFEGYVPCLLSSKLIIDLIFSLFSVKTKSFQTK